MKLLDLLEKLEIGLPDARYPIGELGKLLALLNLFLTQCIGKTKRNDAWLLLPKDIASKTKQFLSPLHPSHTKHALVSLDIEMPTPFCIAHKARTRSSPPRPLAMPGNHLRFTQALCLDRPIILIAKGQLISPQHISSLKSR